MRVVRWLRVLAVLVPLAACGAPSRPVPPPTPPSIEIQGHRGARGLFPENTLEGFREAMRIGVDTLELDVGITADGAVVVHHDEALNVDLARLDGEYLPEPIPIRELTLAELARYDVGRLRPGSDYAARFEAQRPVDGASIPTLAAVLEMATELSDAIRFNVETKLTPDHPELTVDAQAFAERAVEVLRAHDALERATLQSFDFRTVVHAGQIAPELDTACLTVEGPTESTVSPEWNAGRRLEDFGGSVPRLVADVGCAIWSPDFGSLDRERVLEAHEAGLRVIPWTVNAPEDIEAVIDLGVDGIISDYPDRVRAVFEERRMAVPRRFP